MQNQPDWEVQCEGLLQALPPEMEPICDSRGEVKDKIFVCIKGGRHDGHTDAAGVLRRGAAAIVTQKKLGLPREYTVPDTRAALARLCARYWGEPAKELRIIGITGTNGKTTTAHLLCHLLQSAGIKTGRIGTDGIVWGEKTQPNPYTTPPPTELHRILHQMVEDGITTVVMEVSSQALEQRRVKGSPSRLPCLPIFRPSIWIIMGIWSDTLPPRQRSLANAAARSSIPPTPMGVACWTGPMCRSPVTTCRGNTAANRAGAFFRGGAGSLSFL